MKRVVSLLVLIVIVLAGCQGPGTDPFAAVREHIEQLVAEGTNPSLAVAVARDGKIIWEEGFGLADRERNIPATEHTVYDLSSVSKPLTATGLMVLAERGLIDLDRPINEYLGDSPIHACVGDVAEATVRRVANHTAGLPAHFQVFYENQPYQPPPLEETILRYGNLASVAGERWKFSNLGYGVLSQAIAEVSGQSFEEFMRQAVFQPLGMAHTSVGIDPGLAEYQAVQYTSSMSALPQRTYDTPGALALYGSAHDLIRFAMFHLKNDLPDQDAILSDDGLDEMQRSTAAAFSAGYGVGWFIVDGQDGLRRVHHSGATAGASANLVLVPEENLALVVLSNTSNSSHEDIAYEMLVALLPGRTVVREMLDIGQEGDQPFSPDPELVGVWQGLVFTYRGDAPLTLEIGEGEEPIIVQLGPDPNQRTALTDVSYGRDSIFFQSSGGGPYLRGCFPGFIGTDEMVQLQPAGLCLELKLRDGELSGSLIALSAAGEEGGYSLTYCVVTIKR